VKDKREIGSGAHGVAGKAGGYSAPDQPGATGSRAVYEIKGIGFSYPSGAGNVFDNLSLTVNSRDILTILGRNGAGKSTLLGCMLGLLKPQSGVVLLNGRDVGGMSEREIASAAGYVPQNHAAVFGYSVEEFVLMGCASRIGLFSKPGEREREDATEAIRKLGISDITHKPYTEISGGERQKAAIARAIVSNPSVVLFDEPTAHLDYGSQLQALRIIKSISQSGYAVVITTHNPEHALLLGGKAALMDRGGGLTSGGAAEVVTGENLSRVYGVDIKLEYVESLGRNACVYPNL
jgi:iron complex transport system ATP-binding protein